MKIYQTLDTVISKHLEFRQKYSAARPIFNPLLGGVWKSDETLFLVFDILLYIQKRSCASAACFNSSTFSFHYQKCSLSRSSMSLSVESALESFDFLEQDATDEAEGTPRSTASGGSGCHDTGYNSTDDYNKDFAGEGSSDASYIVDFMISAKTVEYHADSSDADVGVNGTEQSVTQNEQLKDGENADTNSLDDSPSCISDIFSSPTAKPVEESASFDETEPACVNPSNTSSPRKRIDGGLDLLVESPQHSSHKTRSSRATSPNLSSSYGLDATVGNKVLDKVRLGVRYSCSCHK